MRLVTIFVCLMALISGASHTTAETLEIRFQNQLNSMGYNVGQEDGILGRKTIAAYREALKNNGISFDGKVDEDDFKILEKIYSSKSKLRVNKIEDCKYLTKSGISRSKLAVQYRGDKLNYPSAAIQTTFGTDHLYTLVFPHEARSKPEYTEGFAVTSCGNQTKFLGTLGVDLNAARDAKEIKLSNGSTGVVIVETGGEFPRKKHDIWEHGKVWIAKLKDDIITVEILENRLAFFHSVTTGDFNDDGLEDIIVQYFNSRDKILKNNGFLLFLQQDKAGNFKRVKPLIHNSTFGSAVLLTNLDDDPELELVQAGYKKPIPPFKGSFKIYDRSNGIFKKKVEFKRESLSTQGAGVSKISEIDFDNDGDNDLLLQVEANKKGLLLYENLGNFKFSLRTEFFADLPSDTAIYQWREAVIADVNDDGFEDVVLNGWGGKEWWENNIGAAVFINKQGKMFERQMNNRKLNQQERSAYYFRYSKFEEMNSFMFFGTSGIIKQVSIPESVFNDD